MKYKKSHLVAALLSAFTLFSSQALAMSVDNLMQIVAKDSATGKTIPGSRTATVMTTA